MRPHPHIRKTIMWGGSAVCGALLAVAVASRPGWTFMTDPRNTACIPSWVPFLLAAVPTAVAWRLDTLATRRAKLGACATCSYDRTGLAPSSPCPECGSVAPHA